VVGRRRAARAATHDDSIVGFGQDTARRAKAVTSMPMT
jgi:hypothetical protein